MAKTRPKIAFLTSTNPLDPRSWSGTHYHLAVSLQKHCGEVVPLGPVMPRGMDFGRAIAMHLEALTGKRYLYHHTPYLSEEFAHIFEQKLANAGFDLIFAAAASTEIAHLECHLPLVYTSDTTVRLMLEYYPSFSNGLAFSVREADEIEEKAIERASLLLYPSAWAARSAKEDYRADARKVHVIPYGANIDACSSLVECCERLPSKPCRLLFVGTNWVRKGGTTAIETLQELLRSGIEAQLVIVGCKLPEGFQHPRIANVPRLDKNIPEQRDLLFQLFRDSDFFVFPTRAECYGIVLCEASAFGLPSITTDTGGVPEIVRANENGVLLPMDAKGVQFAKAIYELYCDSAQYLAMRRSARKRFETVLNWDAWGREAASFISSVI